MKMKIRSKLILAISTLMVVLFSIVAILFITEKKTEMADDIYVNTLAFSKLTAPKVIENYDLYLSQSGFVYFNREIKSILSQNSDVSVIKVITYGGDILYDSSIDVDKRYSGEVRKVSDVELLSQVKSESISVKTLSGEILFADEEGDSILGLKKGTLLDSIVVPANEEYSVVYTIDYHNLNERVSVMIERIIYLAIFGILMGMLLSFFMSARVTKPVQKLVAGAEGISRGDFKTRVDIQTGDEIAFLGDSFNKMAQDLEASIEVKLYKDRVEHELKLAAMIQDQILPDEKSVAKIPGIDFAFDLVPAEEIGGDMYDFLPFDGKKFRFYLGDVTGHGVPAGIVSSISSALFYGYSGYAELKDMMVNVNRVLKAKTMTNMFMTLCLMEWDAISRKFSYVSAGHEQLIHYSAKSKKAVLLPAGGIALGMVPDVSKLLKVNDVDFNEGDFVVVYSDGIPEMWRDEKETYGFDRFLKIVEAAGNKGVTVSEMKEAILNDAKDFAGGYKQQDDVTLIVVKRC